MGYAVDFEGHLNLDKPLTEFHRAYLEKFSQTRRMKRNVVELVTLPDLVRERAGLPPGPDGAYFVGSTAYFGQDIDSASVDDYNHPPDRQSGLWCFWTPDSTGSYIECPDGMSFDNYVEWLQYLIDNFISPWGYNLNGEITWQEEEEYDQGLIRVQNNQIQVRFQPAMEGLNRAMHGMPAEDPVESRISGQARRFLGWTTGTHWLLQ